MRQEIDSNFFSFLKNDHLSQKKPHHSEHCRGNMLPQQHSSPWAGSSCQPAFFPQPGSLAGSGGDSVGRAGSQASQAHSHPQRYKLDLEKAEEPEIKLPTSVGS